MGTSIPQDNAAAILQLEGAQSAMRDVGLTLPCSRQLTAPLWHRDIGEMAMTIYLESGQPIDGLFCFNDELAIGALRALYRLRRDVPEDVAVVGFDDTIDAAYSTPSLTTISPGTSEIARMSIERLLAQAVARGATAVDEHIIAPYELIVRESTTGVGTST